MKDCKESLVNLAISAFHGMIVYSDYCTSAVLLSEVKVQKLVEYLLSPSVIFCLWVVGS